MTPEQALRKYENKRSHCQRRGIPFTLTFKEWVDAWGQRAPDDRLQLQRIEQDKGFIAGNIRVAERPTKQSACRP